MGGITPAHTQRLNTAAAAPPAVLDKRHLSSSTSWALPSQPPFDAAGDRTSTILSKGRLPLSFAIIIFVRGLSCCAWEIKATRIRGPENHRFLVATFLFLISQ